MCYDLCYPDDEEYLLGQRRPTSDEEDEFMEMDAMSDV
jgi:hypothetical protein